jgi:hypothetical protein
VSLTPIPSVGRDVHYVSHGSPVRPDGSQAYRSKCIAAKITEVGGPYPEPGFAGLVVFNPGGLFFHSLAEGGCAYDDRPPSERAGGSWHWPERVGP